MLRNRRNCKTLISGIIACLIILCMAFPAFAAEENGLDNQSDFSRAGNVDSAFSKGMQDQTDNSFSKGTLDEENDSFSKGMVDEAENTIIAPPAQTEAGQPQIEQTPEPDIASADPDYLNTLMLQGKAYYYGTAQNGYDREKAKEYFMEAAAAGDSEAWCYLGYLKIGCTDFDRYEQAMKCFEKAYECGYGPGLVGQGMLYEDGLGVEQDYEKAFELYTQAAEEGYAEGYYGLASLYLYGNGVVQDETVALEYFKMALESQDAIWRNDAKCRIASMYTEDIPGIGQDYSAAYDWYMQAVNEGYGSGFIGIGNMYYFGDGVNKDYSEAYSWFQRGAAHGNPIGMYDVGYMLEYGQGVDQDYEQALKYYEQAAEQGNVDAMYQTGRIYANLDGKYGTTSIPAKAEYWLSIALHFTDDPEMIEDINEILPYVTPGY